MIFSGSEDAVHGRTAIELPEKRAKKTPLPSKFFFELFERSLELVHRVIKRRLVHEVYAGDFKELVGGIAAAAL